MSTNQEVKENNYVPTVLSLLEYDENVMSDIQKEMLADEISELPPIEEGDINVSGVYVFDLGDKLEVKIYLRNGFKKKVNFEYIPFAIVNSKDETLAYQVFNLSEIGSIPSMGARPWKLIFDKKNVYSDKISMDDCRVVFDAKVEAVNYANIEYENLPENLEHDHKEVFVKFLKDLPKIKAGNFGISKFNVVLQKDGNLTIVLVIRNGVNRPVQLEELPITVKDGNGKVIASNMFITENLEVGPNKARICYFMFPTGLEVEEETELVDCSVSFTRENVKETVKETVEDSQL